MSEGYSIRKSATVPRRPQANVVVQRMAFRGGDQVEGSHHRRATQAARSMQGTRRTRESCGSPGSFVPSALARIPYIHTFSFVKLHLRLLVTLGVIVLTLILYPLSLDALLDFRDKALHELLIPAHQRNGVLALAPPGITSNLHTLRLYSS